MLITLNDLKPNQLTYSYSNNSNEYNQSEIKTLQQQFQLLIRQKQLSLPIEPLISNHPYFSLWLKQLAQFIPGLFDPNKKLYLSTHVASSFKYKSISYTLQIPVNVAIIRQQYYLLEIGLRSTQINWKDQIKLWTATRFFRPKQSEISLIICAFSLTQAAERVIHRWTEQEQKLTTQLIKSLLNPQPKPIPKPDNKFLLDFDSIPEIAI